MINHHEICVQCHTPPLTKEQSLTMVSEYLETMKGLNPKFCEALSILVPEAVRKKK